MEDAITDIETVIPSPVIQHQVIIFGNADFVVVDDVEGFVEPGPGGGKAGSGAKGIPAFHGPCKHHVPARCFDGVDSEEGTAHADRASGGRHAGGVVFLACDTALWFEGEEDRRPD